MSGNVAVAEVRLNKSEHLLLDAVEGRCRCAYYHAERGRRTAKAATLEDVCEELFADDPVHDPYTVAWYVRQQHGSWGASLP